VLQGITRRLKDPEELRTDRVAHDASTCTMRAWSTLRFHLRRRHLYVRNFDPRCFEPIFAALERARERAAREFNLSLY